MVFNLLGCAAPRPGYLRRASTSSSATSSTVSDDRVSDAGSGTLSRKTSSLFGSLSRKSSLDELARSSALPPPPMAATAPQRLSKVVLGPLEPVRVIPTYNTTPVLPRIPNLS
ncbi:hypothetical protein GGF31_002045 [Allomyces arbusculus]|nr:hypothetical protein GGF31_002045 [Allomyces arbusculus]